MNLTLPEWVHDYFPEPLIDTSVLVHNIIGFTPLMRKLLAGKICLENFIFIILFIDPFYAIYTCKRILFCFRPDDSYNIQQYDN